jgi:hypothetical protein
MNDSAATAPPPSKTPPAAAGQPRRPRRWLGPAALAIVLGLAIAAALGWRAAVQRLKAEVESALGPRASVASLDVRFGGVEIRSLRVRAEPGRWPADDELRAERVLVVPRLATLWRAFGGGGAVEISAVQVEGAQLTMLRTRDGRLRVLPALLERGPQRPGTTASKAAVPPLRIEQVQLRDTSIVLFDASVRSPPHRLQLQRLRADFGPLQLPALDVATRIDLDAELAGTSGAAGRVAVDGRVTFATRDAALTADVRGVDLVALQPYLLKTTEAGVRRGTLDLRLAAEVRGQRLHAPGHLTLRALELASGDGPLATFAGVPRQAVIAAMSRDGRIELDFTLEGRLDDPKFSLNEVFALKVAAGLAQALGVSVQGVVEGVGGVLKGLFGR